MAVAEKTPEAAAAPAAARRRRSFRPRYPAWLTAPSLLYYAIFFLGPMAILVAFSLATQQGFGSLSVRVRHVPVPADRQLAVPHHLRAHAGDGRARLAC